MTFLLISPTTTHKHTFRRMSTTGLIQLWISEHLNNCRVKKKKNKCVLEKGCGEVLQLCFMFSCGFLPSSGNLRKRYGIYCMSRWKCVCLCVKQKIQNELNGHEATLGDMRKKNQDKDASQKLMGQIDNTQVLYMILYTHVQEKCKNKVFMDQ